MLKKCIFSAETTTPPLLGSPGSSESDIYVCQTRNCIQPSHYFRASTSQDGGANATCFYGAKQCPSKVAKAKTTKHCQHSENEKEDGPSVEDTQLLQKHTCCSKPDTEKCCKSSQIQTSDVVVHEPDISSENSSQERENSPQITCCHAKSTPSDSQEQIVT